MMGGSGYTSMMGPSGYAWMMGGTAAPVWMADGTLPGYMTGTSTDSGKVMGSLFADGPRVAPADAATLARRVPTGATVDRAANRVTFTTTTVAFTVVASPSMSAENFRVAGLTNPTIVEPPGTKVSIELVNADTDMAHGLVVTAAGSGTSSRMPMMTAPPAFSSSALWFLGEATSAGMHEGTVTFTAGQAGTYQYLCPVPGHAQEGMAGTIIVS